MSTVIFWFRNDLRLHDQPALHAALAGDTRHLLPVFCLPEAAQASPWGFERMGPQRRAWLATALRDLERQLASLGCPLLVCSGPAGVTLPALAQAVGASRVVCEDIAAPEEQAEVQALRMAGLQIRTIWQSSLLAPLQLPWGTNALPASFTTFKQAVERNRIAPPVPLAAPTALPPWPVADIPPSLTHSRVALEMPDWGDALADSRSSLPIADGGESAGLAHLAQYFASKLPDSYKQTRNGLTGVDYSSKWSPWLATGALSVRRIYADLQGYEAQHGASDGSYWLWFELLWRDYFRLLHLQYGRRLYGARGLSPQPMLPHNVQGFKRWCQARTGEPLIDAAMRELATTGYLSNRLRQVVASYLLHELRGDWRAGAAWFESQLVDYDVYSNQGNWLYIAGRGTDPRGGRQFNVKKQTAEHDAKGSYRHLWSL